MKIKELGCNIKAIPFLIRTGVWIPHLYEEIDEHKGIVIATANDFRESTSLQHSDNEEVHQNATIITMRCVHCGKKIMSWFDKEPMLI